MAHSRDRGKKEKKKKPKKEREREHQKSTPHPRRESDLTARQIAEHLDDLTQPKP
ncbi:MAG: hypothetical protein M5U01_42325 [Ardenticatenaceae bacterium]|nr:hypothetical protein [Ardenticatenaceae bacterium]